MLLLQSHEEVLSSRWSYGGRRRCVAHCLTHLHYIVVVQCRQLYLPQHTNSISCPESTPLDAVINHCQQRRHTAFHVQHTVPLGHTCSEAPVARTTVMQTGVTCGGSSKGAETRGAVCWLHSSTDVEGNAAADMSCGWMRLRLAPASGVAREGCSG